MVDAIEAFWADLADVRLGPLALGLACQLVKVACTSRAWRNVLAAAYPESKVRWRSIYGAYVAGVGVNAVFPARAGDLARLYLAHRAIPGSTYATLISSTVVLTIVDFTLALGLFLWALTQGVLPGLDILPSLPGFDFAWLLRHDTVGQLLVAFLAAGLLTLLVWARMHVANLREHVTQAFAVLRSPARYARTVVAWQLGDWGLRLVTIWLFLGAFGIHQSVRNVLLVQATLSLATLVPISPGGVGTEQALLVVVLGGEASRTALLAFSVGMKATLTAVNVVVGFVAILLTLRTLRFRRLTATVRGAAEGPE